MKEADLIDADGAVCDMQKRGMILSMKHKYKRVILYGTTFIWCLGFLQLSFFPVPVIDAGPGPAPITAVTGALSPTPAQITPMGQITEPAATPTPVPSPTPTPIPQAISVPLELTSDSAVIDTVSLYLHALYSNDMDALKAMVTDISELNSARIENLSADVASVDNVTCHVKPGTEEISVIVYACADISYKSSPVGAPLLEEIYLKEMPDGSYLIYNKTPSIQAQEVLLRTRKSSDVMELYIDSLIKRYFQARLSCDPVRIRSCVQISNTELEILTEKVRHIEEYQNLSCLIKPGINEFDYIVYVSYDTKIVSIDTPAPSLDEIYIYINPNSGKPYIYQGTISDESAEYAYTQRTTEDVTALTNDVTERLKAALAADDALREYCERLLAAATSS